MGSNLFAAMSYTPIVQKLVDYLTENPKFDEAFRQSFALAYATGLEEFETYKVHSVDEYIRFMNDFVNWTPSENLSGTNAYNHICLFYFIIDLPPVHDHQSPIDPSSKSPWRWLSQWLIDYAQEMGKWMDTPESINPESIKTFYKAPVYHMEDYPVPPGGWKTFNQFFARHIDPAKRPIASPNDPSVIVSPADCAFDGYWPVNDSTADVSSFDVKGVPWSISQLLDDATSGTNYGKSFAGGVFTHSFLNTTDYHRQHAPVSGRIVEAKVIPGLCYLEVVLKANDNTDTSGDKPKNGRPHLGMHRGIREKKEDDTIIPYSAIIAIGAGPDSDTTPTNSITAPDTPGYQFLQARGLVLIDSPELGLVAVLPIGMAQVSSVVLSVKAGDYVEKGQEISYFQFGGSDIVMVFQKDANVKFHQEINEHYNFGTAVATATVKK